MTAKTEPEQTQKRAGSRRIVFSFLFAAAILALAFVSSGFFLRGFLKRGILSTLKKRFDGNVQVQQLDVFVFPSIGAVAQGITIQTKDHPDPPLIAIRKLTLSANLLNLLRRHISRVSLEGLQIRVPPRPEGKSSPSGVWSGRKVHFALVIDEVDSTDALLETLPRDARHVPRDFVIHRLALHSFSFDNPSPFIVTLTNPVPAGEIESAGQFGPWNAEEPADTPVSGTFSYSHADFNSIKGLSGIMSSDGSYSGTLDSIKVQGTAEMPDFSLDIVGNPMRLTTRYAAVVDGTTGNTYLDSVDAVLGNSPIHVHGEIVGIPGVHGRKIALEATSQNARAEDLTHLAVKGPAPLEGIVKLRTKIDVPPIPKGKSALELIALDGQFDISDARFTGTAVQNKVDALSRAGRGRPKSADIRNVQFHLNGKFAVSGGAVHVSQTTFALEGASVQADGSYQLKGGELDFRGRLNLDAKASQATTGVKSAVLKLFDPIFERHGKGFSIAFRVAGTRDHPLIRP